MKIGGILENTDLTLYRITTFDDAPGAAGAILKFYAQRNINLEYITESGSVKGQAFMGICIKNHFVPEVDKFIKENKDRIKEYHINKIEDVSTISIYGPHFREKHSIAARFCSLLGAQGVNILGLSSSVSSICAVIKSNQLINARQAILKKFELP
jgi:aspartokinase